MFVRDNSTSVFVMGSIILATMNMLHDRLLGFFLWMGMAFVFIIMDLLRMNAELRMIQRRLRHIKFLERKLEEDKKKKKRKK